MTTSRRLIGKRGDEEAGEGGLSLIELLIVVLVLGIVAAIIVLAMQDLTGDSAKVACKADARTVEIALVAQKAKAPGLAGSVSGYATTVGALVPAYVRSAPSSTHYKISVGQAAATTAGSTDSATIAAGTVLVAMGTSTVYKDLRSATNPCDAVI